MTVDHSYDEWVHFKGSNSAIFIFASLLNGSQFEILKVFTESREPFIGAVSRDYILREGLQLEHLWILNDRIQITQETPEESYYRRNLGLV